MASLQRLPNDALVLVCDARKALFLRNSGSELRPTLEVIQTLDVEPPAAERDLKGNPPGRKADIHHGDGSHGPKSAIEPPDYARLDAEAFAAQVAVVCRKLFDARHASALVVAAPSRMLGALRDTLPAELRQKILAEIPKALTGRPVDGLADHLVAEW